MHVLPSVCLCVCECWPVRRKDLYGGVHFIMASDSSAEVVLQQRRLGTMKRILQVHRYVLSHRH